MNNHANGSDKLLASQLMKYRGEFCLLSVGFTGSGETLNKDSIPVFLLLCLKKEEARGQEA
jgi:hypothetical protein